MKYRKITLKKLVKYIDLVICYFTNIEKYIHECYDGKRVNGANRIAYGVEIRKSQLADNAERFVSWLKEKKLLAGEYLLAA